MLKIDSANMGGSIEGVFLIGKLQSPWKRVEYAQINGDLYNVLESGFK